MKTGSEGRTGRRNSNHRAMSGGPFCRPAGPAAAADEQQGPRKRCGGVGARSRCLLEPRSTYASRLPSAGPCVERWSGAAGHCRRRRDWLQSPGRCDRDWPPRARTPEAKQMATGCCHSLLVEAVWSAPPLCLGPGRARWRIHSCCRFNAPCSIASHPRSKARPVKAVWCVASRRQPVCSAPSFGFKIWRLQ